MTASSRYRQSVHFADHYAGDDHWDVMPGDRAGPPLVRRRRKLVVRGALLLALALGTGWAMRDGPSFWAAVEQVSSAATGIAKSVLERKEPQQAAGADAAKAGAALPPLAELTPKAGANETRAEAAPAQAPVDPPAKEAAEPQEPAPTAEAAPPEPLPPPPPASSLEAYQKRAAAVGLHTDLSRLLLESLTETDYRNAEIAIRNAFADKSPDAVHVWPRQAKPGLAQFQVHFVRGATGCRRYVVTIGRQGWSTTALPLERCGTNRSAAARE